MANTYFQFKQFRINQDQCAMKVCTDSCILGAYAAVEKAYNIQDIGTGTGLLALMAAQRTQANITAIEIDELAAQQATENILASKWAKQIIVKHQSLQEFAEENHQLYDVILCNPPFYKASHKSPDAARNVAMHSQDLTFQDIISFCTRFLASATGQLYLLLPPAESLIFAQLASGTGLYVQERLLIYTQTNGKHIRTIQVFSKKTSTEISEKTLFIRQADNTYTDEFQQLLKEYYLLF